MLQDVFFGLVLSDRGIRPAEVKVNAVADAHEANTLADSFFFETRELQI